MSGSGEAYLGDMAPQDEANDFRAMEFLAQQVLNRMATTTLVQVVEVHSTFGAVAPVGTLDCRPMIAQIDGYGNPTEHGVIHNVPYMRLQGGTSAVILDPQPGDIGIAVFCSRDMSQVKRTKAPGGPPSRRRYDWADALYFGGVLNGLPTQYLRFYDGGIDLVAPGKTLNFNCASLVVNGNVQTTGTITNNGHDIGSTHRHINSGGTGTGGVPV